MKLDILAFGAHPDDVEISAGGLLIAEAKKGKATGIVDLTRGELGTRGTPEIRMQEAEAAAAILGLKVRLNLGMPDGMFELSNQNKLKIIEVIRKYRPEVVLTNAPHDRHPDHGRAAQLVVEACYLAGLRKIETAVMDEGPWRPIAVYQYMQFYHHKADFIYDISDMHEQKIKSILAHKSQFYDPNSNEPDTVIASKHFFDNLTARASEYGLQAGFKFGEPLLVLRPPGVQELSALK